MCLSLSRKLPGVAGLSSLHTASSLPPTHSIHGASAWAPKRIAQDRRASIETQAVLFFQFAMGTDKEQRGKAHPRVFPPPLFFF